MDAPRLTTQQCELIAERNMEQAKEAAQKVSEGAVELAPVATMHADIAHAAAVLGMFKQRRFQMNAGLLSKQNPGRPLR